MERKLTAILSADVEGYSRLMGKDEEATVKTLNTYREAMSRLIEEHQGRVIDSPGDNLLAEFTSAVNAVQCAAVIQGELRVRNMSLAEDRRMNFRIGVNLGDVIVEGDRIYGDGVNVAARVESLAEGGGISVSGIVYSQVVNKLSYAFDDLGEHTVKNIAELVRVYAVHWDEEKTSTVKDKSYKLGLWTVAVVLVLSALSVIVWRQVYEEPQTEIPSIAVLPFRDMSPDKDQEYFCEGIAEEILNALAQVEGLRVAARTSSFRLRNEAISTIGEQLNVTTVLEGSVRKEGNSIRITAQLNNAADNFHLWSKNYDRELKNVFALQDEIAHAITQVLQVKLMGEKGAPLVKTYTENTEAYDHYLQGLYLWNKRIVSDEQTTEYLKTAIKQFKEAIALDPNYALAYSGLARAIHFSQNRPPENISVAERITFRKDFITQSQEALEKALTLDPNLAEAHAFLGFIKRNSYDMRGAEKEFRLAIDSNPEYADTHHWYSMMLASVGRLDEAIKEGEKALELDPISHTYNAALALLLEITGQGDAAIQQYEKTVMLYPEREAVQWYLNNIGILHLKVERIDEAVDAFSRWSEHKAISIDEETLWLFCKNVIEYRRTGIPMSLPPKLEADPKIGVCFLEFNGLDYRNFIYSVKNKDPDFYLAHFYVKMGQKEKALESLEQAQKKAILARHGFPPYYVFALLYAELNEKEKTLEFLEQVYEHRGVILRFLKITPAFDFLRSEPRFIALMRKVGLE